MHAQQPAAGTNNLDNRRLRIAALIKQVPVAESLTLGDDGRLPTRRHGARDEPLLPTCRIQRSRAGPGVGRQAARSSPWARRPPRTCCARRSPGGPTGECISATPRSPAPTPWPPPGRLPQALRREGPFDLVLVETQFHRRGHRTGGARGGRAGGPAVCRRRARARVDHDLAAPHARGRRRLGGRGGTAPGTGVGGRAPLRALQGRPRGSPGRPCRAASRGVRAGSGRGTVGRGGEPHQGRRGTGHGPHEGPAAALGGRGHAR